LYGRFIVSLSFGLSLSVTTMYFGKAADWIELLFGVVGRVGPRSHVLDGVQIPHGKEQFLEGNWRNVKYKGECGNCHAKMAELIDLLFEMVSQ